MALPATGRAAHPIFAGWIHAIIGLGKLDAPDALLVDAVARKVLDQALVEGAIGIECEGASRSILRRVMAGIRRGADIASVGRVCDTPNGASVSAATEV